MGTGQGGEERLTSVARTRLPLWSIVAHIGHTSTSVVLGSKSRSLTDSQPVVLFSGFPILRLNSAYNGTYACTEERRTDSVQLFVTWEEETESMARPGGLFSHD